MSQLATGRAQRCHTADSPRQFSSANGTVVLSQLTVPESFIVARNHAHLLVVGAMSHSEAWNAALRLVSAPVVSAPDLELVGSGLLVPRECDVVVRLDELALDVTPQRLAEVICPALTRLYPHKALTVTRG